MPQELKALILRQQVSPENEFRFKQVLILLAEVFTFLYIYTSPGRDIAKQNFPWQG